jgi:[ribosomal protein S18]-alanine N-acetyltransferase
MVENPLITSEPQEEGSSFGFFACGCNVLFRPMINADLEQILEIEKASFKYPWSRRFFLEEVQVECARAVVAEIADRVIGYVLFWLLPDDVDVHNIAVHPDYRRRAIGRSLLEYVVAAAQQRSSAHVTLEVRKSNEAAQQLYKSLGFAITGERRGYYSDDGEDALTMALNLRL